MIGIVDWTMVGGGDGNEGSTCGCCDAVDASELKDNAIFLEILLFSVDLMNISLMCHLCYDSLSTVDNVESFKLKPRNVFFRNNYYVIHIVNYQCAINNSIM